MAVKYICDDCGCETTKERVFVDNYNDPQHASFVQCEMCQHYREAFSRRLLPLGAIVRHEGGQKYLSFADLSRQIGVKNGS